MLGQCSLGLLVLFAFPSVVSSQTQKRLVLQKPDLSLPVETETYRIEEDDDGNFRLHYQHYNGSQVTGFFEPATKVDVTVSATVSYDRSRGIYTYHYDVHNLASSEQRLGSFAAGYSSAVFDLAGPAGSYIGALRLRPVIRWSNVSEEQRGVAPGSTQGGFRFSVAALSSHQSYTERLNGTQGYFYRYAQLPGIVKCYARGHTAPLSLPHEAPQGLTDRLPRVLEDAVFGNTIGPVQVPQDVNPVDLLDRLTSYVETSVAEGWIRDAATAEPWLARLAVAREAFQIQDFRLVRGTLQTLITEAEQARDSDHITSEALALITYNVRFLVSLF